MALINCPECGREISEKATSCPHCGIPLGKKKFCKFCGASIDENCVVCPECGKQVESVSNASRDDRNIIINNNNAASASSAATVYVSTLPKNLISPKSRLVAFLLCLFLGVIGFHRFYVGKIGTGIIMILLMFTGIGEIWLLIDFIMIIVGSFTDKDGLRLKNWNP